jgi:hypothetical protein
VTRSALAQAIEEASRLPAPRPKVVTKRSTLDEDDADERHPWWARGAIAAALLAACYFGWSWYDLGPVQKINADRIMHEFSRDPRGANRHYSGRRCIVQGKLVVREDAPGAPSIQFEPSGPEVKVKLRCAQFSNPSEMKSIRSGSIVEISGVIQSYEEGGFVELKNCTVQHERRDVSSLEGMAAFAADVRP